MNGHLLVLYTALGILIASVCIIRLNTLGRKHSVWYRYAYVIGGIGGGCIPFRIFYPDQFAYWPSILVATSLAMIVLFDQRRPPKESCNDTATN